MDDGFNPRLRPPYYKDGNEGELDHIVTDAPFVVEEIRETDRYHDSYFCSLACPYFYRPDYTDFSTEAYCLKYEVSLMYYDWYLAACANGANPEAHDDMWEAREWYVQNKEVSWKELVAQDNTLKGK